MQHKKYKTAELTAIRAGRRQQMEKKFYIAYGSNLNMRQMAWRCPDAKPLYKGYLTDYELFYAGSKSGNYATIRKKEGAITPVGIWEISEADEKALDRYEGYPVFYYKDTIKLRINGEVIKAIVYIMRKDAIEGLPTGSYISTIRQGYRDFGLDEKYITESLRIRA